jgi:hypothetical protein
MLHLVESQKIMSPVPGPLLHLYHTRALCAIRLQTSSGFDDSAEADFEAENACHE